MCSRVAAVNATRALEIRWGQKKKEKKKSKHCDKRAAFTDPTVRSHVTEAERLRLRLDVCARQIRELDALVKRETKLIIPRHMD